MKLVRRTGGGIEVRIDHDEAGVLAQLGDQVLELIVGDREAPAPPADTDDPLAVAFAPPPPRPEDPALLRLFPDAYGDDDQAAAEFRRFTAAELEQVKVQRLQAVTGALREASPHPVLSDADAEVWLTALTDIRLVLAERLGVVSDDDAAILDTVSPRDPRWVLVACYGLLTDIQDGLVRELSGSSRR
jgi:hypothetical protein